MSEELYTVEQAAERLKLHPKTVLRFVREGRLRATKVGKQYRILRSDLESLAGQKPVVADVRVRVTAVVDVSGGGAELAQKLGRLPAVRMGPEAHAEPMAITVSHDPSDDRVKVVLVGSSEDVAAMLRLIQVVTER